MTYHIKNELKPSGLKGISEQQISDHWGLYEGYVKQSNTLKEELAALRAEGKGTGLLYADRRRRFGFEFCGMIIHEYYFGNLEAGHSVSEAPSFKEAVGKAFGSYENWLADFKACGATRGVGHAVCYMDPETGDINNHFIELHNDGHIPSYHILLSMDVWEHAFMVDYPVSARGKYIDAFMENVNWPVVEARLKAASSKSGPVRHLQAA